MIFEPEPGMSIDLHDESIEFVAVQSEGRPSVFVYAESGKEGTVYKVLKGEEFYALKVFYPEYRNRRLLENTKKLSRFKNLEGFRVAERTIINRQRFPDLITSYPELHYSVLMPWIEGTVWGNLQSMEDNLLDRKDYLQIAQSLIRVVSKLEAQGLAHCDLSNYNFIIDPNDSSVQLIDIEDMYAPDMPHPVPDISYGTPGYRTRWIAENGLWGPASDRFASAILCAEILAWHDPEIRRSKAGEVSYFDEEEIGENSERYRLMKEFLATVDPDISLLFEKAWFASAFDECPSVADWRNALEQVIRSTFNVQEKATPSTSKTVPKKRRQMSQRAGTTVDSPSRMQITPSIIDFGTVKHPDIEREIEILNIGGSLLTGTIHSEVSWIDVSQDHFSLKPGESCAVTISLNNTLPRAAKEYRPPNALVIESHDVREVLGATYKLEGTSSNQLLFGWVFLGLLTTVLLANYFPNIYTYEQGRTDFPSPIYFGVVGLVAGLATKTVTNFRAFQDILKAAAIAGGVTMLSQLIFSPYNVNLPGTLTLNLILLTLLMLVFAKALNRDKATFEKKPAQFKEGEDTTRSRLQQESAAGTGGKRKTRKTSTGSVYVFAAEGTPLYASLPASNNWIVWLENGAELSSVEPLEDVISSVSKYGYYIEVIDKDGNRGFVTATAVKLKFS
jgi:serine/threonine protein kinase